MTDAERRMLKIKTQSVVRLKKELGMYEKEQEQEKQRVARMKQEGADPHDIKHAVGIPDLSCNLSCTIIDRTAVSEDRHPRQRTVETAVLADPESRYITDLIFQYLMCRRTS
jgi:hypothetical protein